MKRSSLCVGVLLCASIASAQPRAGAFTTLVTTDTGATSLCVGANAIAAPTTCLGGLNTGPVVANQAITFPSFTPASTVNRLYQSGGTLMWNGLALATGGSVGPGTAGTIPIFTAANAIGNSVITQVGTVTNFGSTINVNLFGLSLFTSGENGREGIQIASLLAGTAATGYLGVSAQGTAIAFLESYSSTFTASVAKRPSGTLLSTSGTDGLGIQATAGPIRFWNATVQTGQITLAGLFQWQTFGTHTFSAGGAGANVLNAGNPTAGAGNFGSIGATSDTVTTSVNAYSSTFTTAGFQVQGGSVIAGNGVGGLSVAATHASGAVRIYTGSATLRATFDSAGNFNLGSTNIMDSPAVPTISSGFGTGATIAGRVTGFRILAGTGSPSGGTVAFNTTFTNVPACVASSGNVGVVALQTAASTTTVVINASAVMANGDSISVICRGY